MKSSKKRVKPVKPVSKEEWAYWENLLTSEGLGVTDQVRQDGVFTSQSIQRKGRTNQALHNVRWETEQYYRVIGLYVNQATLKPFELKYRELLLDYSTSGSLLDCCYRHKINHNAAYSYLKRNFPKMLSFVNALEIEIEEDEVQYDNRN